MRPLFHQPRTRTRRATALALLCVLVLAQTLGWLHRGLHGSDGPALQAPAATQVHAHAQAHDDEAPAHWLAALFGSHADASDCRLFDVIGQPGCVPGLVLALPALPPAAFLVATHGDFVARWTALFDARGPPPPR